MTGENIKRARFIIIVEKNCITPETLRRSSIAPYMSHQCQVESSQRLLNVSTDNFVLVNFEAFRLKPVALLFD